MKAINIWQIHYVKYKYVYSSFMLYRNMTPKVSVIMPCYNEPGDVFSASLDSVIEQTLKDIEIIIVLDNPDNEELREIINSYKSRNENILFLDPWENLGRWMARNLAIEKANGKYINHY